jgi:uncharacterized membrane protein (Fun14 family)
MTTDLAPFAGTVGGGFFIGLITGYAIKKVIKLTAVIVGLFFAALAYMEYQRILNVDRHKVQAISQNGIDWVADALTHVSSTMGAITFEFVIPVPNHPIHFTVRPCNVAVDGHLYL